MSDEITQTISQKLDRVLYILENDEKTNRKGLVEEVAEMRKQLDELITKDKVLAGKMTLLGILGGALFALISWLIDVWINKK